MRRAFGVGFLALGLAAVGVVAAVPRVADERPASLGREARPAERLWTRAGESRRGQKPSLDGLTEPEREGVSRLATRLSGRIVWSSNRSGNHELYLLDVPRQTVRRLTTHSHVDFFSRFSPDGRRIVFLRSQRERVSAREATAWDVFVLDVDRGAEQRIARGGYHPTWTGDGSAVIFEREGRVFRFELATGRESVILDGKQALPGTGEIGDFELSPDGRHLAFGLRGTFAGALGLQGRFSGAVVMDLERRALAKLTSEQACQTTWSPDGQTLLWVETGGQGGTRVMAGRSDGSGRRVFMDLPGRYSHEYFPRLSNDGRWLIWGAAAAGHEHDQADYEIFLWEVGAPVEEVVRLTHDGGNDQWPDLHVSR